ncbi:translation initiation factor IF-2 subunit alpha [Candidatus Micrarchaeota archaeon]|nr:MAG: translation initiation factor IF-2 subunit alpha [Candidatus Micrarchaeota archaeon]
MSRKEWPETGELVVIKIKRVSHYGAIAELLEYPGKEGFIHISNVANSWVKNIRSFVSEGQVRVASVIRVNPDKRIADLSLRKISAQQEKRRLSDWKRKKRANKIFENLCKKLKEDPEKAYAKVAEPLIDVFGDLYSVFENIKLNGPEVLDAVKIPEKWKKLLIEYTNENISIPEVEIKGVLTLTSTAPDGVDLIKKALLKAKSNNVNIYYISAPRYAIEVKGKTYQEAEKRMEKAVASVVDYMKKHGGEASFERIKT